MLTVWLVSFLLISDILLYLYTFSNSAPLLLNGMFKMWRFGLAFYRCWFTNFLVSNLINWFLLNVRCCSLIHLIFLELLLSTNLRCWFLVMSLLDRFDISGVLLVLLNLVNIWVCLLFRQILDVLGLLGRHRFVGDCRFSSIGYNFSFSIHWIGLSSWFFILRVNLLDMTLKLRSRRLCI